MDLQTQYQESIRKAFPQVQIKTARFRRGGQFSDVLIVNGNTVFRFPRYPRAVERLAYEVPILQALQNNLPLAIPNPVYVHLSAPVGQAFTGYSMIPATR